MTIDDERTYKVDMLTRVEGEGSFYLRTQGRLVQEARLSIFEAPRFFEAFLRGRSLFEVPDIVARICGICPVAYQMTSVAALEMALGIDVGERIKRLRRLLYCGEWIQSHALHVFMLHAPDFLGYQSVVEMAKQHGDVVERALRMKKAGNELIGVLGGRASHPVSPRVGGFSKVPGKEALVSIRGDLENGLEEAIDAVRWSAALPMPEADVDYVFVSLQGDDYPLEGGGRLAISGRDPVPVESFSEHFIEHQVPYSNALQCKLKDGRPYLVGPLARINQSADRLHPTAETALSASGLSLPVRNPYRSIVVRCVELVHAFAEALDLIDAYDKPTRPFEEAPLRAGGGCGATEAPRGLLFHEYAVDDRGLVKNARIVPPTSQNQARIEQDLASIADDLLSLEHRAAVQRCEQLIRSYDPCISCATHFLELSIEQNDSPPGGPAPGRR